MTGGGGGGGDVLCCPLQRGGVEELASSVKWANTGRFVRKLSYHSTRRKGLSVAGPGFD